MGKGFLSTFLAAAVLSFLPTISFAAIVINEFDYDQPGTDDAEFIELYNSGSASVSLDGYVIDLINGSNDSVYRSIDLSGFMLLPDDFFVVCGNTDTVANCSLDIGANTNRMQNSDEGIALFDGASLIDSVTYEGIIAPYTEGVQGTIADPGSVAALGLSRLFNGIDTNNNMADFVLGCSTPGAVNIAYNGSCVSVSAVPVPDTVWLFGTGLASLIGVMRCRRKVLLKSVARPSA